MLQAERVSLLMKRRTHAARVLTKLAKINYLNNHQEKFSEKNLIGLIRSLKFEMENMKIVQRQLDLYQNRLSFEEELNRQFFFLKEQFHDVKEKVLICSELQNVLFECMEIEIKDNNPINPKIIEKKSSSIDQKSSIIDQYDPELDKLYPFSSDVSSLEEMIESFSFEKTGKGKDTNQSSNKKTPLLSHFMREKRKSDYKLNTERLRSPINKLAARNDEDTQKNAKAFINKRKSQIFKG